MLGYRLDVERAYCLWVEHVVVERVEVRVIAGLYCLHCLLLVHLYSIVVHVDTGVIIIDSGTGWVYDEVATTRGSIEGIHTDLDTCIQLYILSKVVVKFKSFEFFHCPLDCTVQVLEKYLFEWCFGT